MSIGIRHFVVDGEKIEKISQKNRQGFYIKQENSLSKYAGRIIDIADICVELVDRKPYKIIRIDCMRHKVNSNGGLDKEYEKDHMKHIGNMIEPPQINSGKK